VLGHAKDSLWSLDLFRCESAVLRTYWVLVVMDQWTRRIVGFGVQRGVVDGVELCRMFNQATDCHTPPTYLSSDHVHGEFKNAEKISDSCTGEHLRVSLLKTRFALTIGPSMSFDGARRNC
jgi:hypothetical protein